MAYIKTAWDEVTERSLANLNNIETQYDEAVVTARELRKDSSKESRVHVAAVAPAGAVVGQVYLNSGDKILYFYNGANWVPLPGLVSIGGIDKEVYSYLGKYLYSSLYLITASTNLSMKVRHGPLIVPGEYTTYYGLRPPQNSGAIIYGQLYKNGLALGALNSVAYPDGITYYTETFNYDVGDTVEMWCRKTGSTEGGILYYFYVHSSLQIKTELF